MPDSSVASTLKEDGTVMTGAVVSCTVIWKDPVDVLPLESKAEQLTTVAPSANVSPELGAQVTGSEPSTMSLAEAEKITVAPSGL